MSSLDDIFTEIPAQAKKDEKKLEAPPKVVAAQTTVQPVEDFFSSDSDKPETGASNNADESEDLLGPEATLSNTALPVKPLPREISFDEVKEVQSKTIYVIYGGKGEGKTTLAFSFPGEIGVLSYDRKAMPIKTDMYDNDKRIHVFDAIGIQRYGDPREFSFTSEETFNYTCALLDDLKDKNLDWIIIDGTEILSQICEAAMRYRNNIQPFAGIKNRNLWKERRLYIRQVHTKALLAAKKGIIYTTYTELEDIIEEGETVSRKKIPAWIDVILTESDIVIFTELKLERGIAKYYATVNSSKRKYMKSGTSVEITGTDGYNTIIEKSKARQ